MATPLSTNPDDPSVNDRHRFSWTILLFGLAAVTILGVVAILADKDSARSVLTAVLPLVGTWVGTILAFYYGKDNLQAATESAKALSNLSGDDKLRAIPAESVMIKRSAIKAWNSDEKPLATSNVKDALEFLTLYRVPRLAILSAKDIPQCVIHRSEIDRYVAENITRPETATMTLEQFLSANPRLAELSKSSFGVIRQAASLAEAKEIMDNNHNIQDVFVTTTGKADAPVLGWITDDTIAKEGRV